MVVVVIVVATLRVVVADGGVRKVRASAEAETIERLEDGPCAGLEDLQAGFVATSEGSAAHCAGEYHARPGCGQGPYGRAFAGPPGGCGLETHRLRSVTIDDEEGGCLAEVGAKARISVVFGKDRESDPRGGASGFGWLGGIHGFEKRSMACRSRSPVAIRGSMPALPRASSASLP